MLPKNRTSAVILSVIFLAGVLAAYTAPILVLRPGSASPASLWTVLAYLFFSVFICFLFPQSALMMGFTQADGFGLRGLARWLACGLILGLSMSVLNKFLLPLMDPKSDLVYFLRTAGGVQLFLISYGIIFRGKIFTLEYTDPHTGREMSVNAPAIRLMYLVSGMVLLSIFWYWAILGFAGNPALFWLSAGGICIGLTSMLIGMLYRAERVEALENRLAWSAFGLVGLAFVLFTAGLVG